MSGEAVTIANSTRADEYEATAGRIFREYRSESRPGRNLIPATDESV